MAKYINKILNKFSVNNLNPSKTPIDSNIKLEPNKEKARLLLYLALACRLDIVYTTIKLARFASNLGDLYLNAIKRIFRYLKGTINLGIIYSSNATSYI
ncbi:Copia protein [Lachnellula occidentalis]|uniref:Copia protein n=1 Tax=Lachnellula occidentalis TaxID=215460 RepID=A0A8H8RLU8_9HELO|nr:Copia protein [Lachnellula occidentalis]